MEKKINFDEYIKYIIFNNEEITEGKIYMIQNFEYKARTVYTGNGTHFNIFDNPNDKKVLFAIKYWTEIVPFEIVKTNDYIWVKIETKEHYYGWIKSCFIELYR